MIGKQHTRAVAVTTSVLEIGLLAIALTFWFAIGLPEQIGFMKPGPGWADVWPAATVVILFALGIGSSTCSGRPGPDSGLPATP